MWCWFFCALYFAVCVFFNYIQLQQRSMWNWKKFRALLPTFWELALYKIKISDWVLGAQIQYLDCQNHSQFFELLVYGSHLWLYLLSKIPRKEHTIFLMCLLNSSNRNFKREFQLFQQHNSISNLSLLLWFKKKKKWMDSISCVISIKSSLLSYYLQRFWKVYF